MVSGYITTRAARRGVVTSSPSVPLRAPDRAGYYYVACDEETGTIFAASASCEVDAWEWDSARAMLVKRTEDFARSLHAACGKGHNFRPLAVVPASGGLPRCLLVGEHYTPKLRVLQLPDCALLGEMALGGDPKVTGLAADPSGASIAVFDNPGGAVRVLPWPLPGLELVPR